MSQHVPPGPSPQRVAAHPHARPQPYSLMLRTWDYRWWKPVIGLAVLVVGVLLLAPMVLVPVLMAGLALQGDDPLGDLASGMTLDRVTPAAMLYLDLSLASAVLVTWLVVRFVHRLRLRWLISVGPGVRWRFLWGCVGLAVVAVAAQMLVGMLLPTASTDPAPHGLKAVTGTTVAYFVVFWLTTPLQAMGEEYAFRGYLQQAVGSLVAGLGGEAGRVRRLAPYVAILLSAGAFCAAHGVQNFPLAADRFAFGLLAGYLVHRTGGLEAGIALHIVNNLVAFSLSTLTGGVADSVTTTTVSWWNLPLTVVQNGLFLVLALWWARRCGVRRLTAPPEPEEPEEALSPGGSGRDPVPVG